MLTTSTMQAQLPSNGDSGTMPPRRPRYVNPKVFYPLPKVPNPAKEIKPRPPSLTFKEAVAKANALDRPRPELPPIAVWSTRRRPMVQRPFSSRQPPRHVPSAPGNAARQPHASSTISPHQRLAHMQAQKKKAKAATDKTPATANNTSQSSLPSFYQWYQQTSSPLSSSANTPGSASTPIDLTDSSSLGKKTSDTAPKQKFRNPLPPRLRVKIGPPPPTEWDDLIDWDYCPPTPGRV
ncbi:hypothetical protein CC79DRAFT_563594 [Sarocladium strictum]